jgi:hypothetical protein
VKDNNVTSVALMLPSYATGKRKEKHYIQSMHPFVKKGERGESRVL